MIRHSDPIGSFYSRQYPQEGGIEKFVRLLGWTEDARPVVEGVSYSVLYDSEQYYAYDLEPGAEYHRRPSFKSWRDVLLYQEHHRRLRDG